jgi:beta-glucosidase
MTDGKGLAVSFTITNTGARAGAEVAQVYVRPPGGAYPRLVGFSKVDLKPGESRRVSITADPRLLASYDAAAPGWRVRAGDYAVTVGGSSADARLQGHAALQADLIKP